MLGRSCAAALESKDSSTCCNTQAFHPNPHKVLLIQVITFILLAPTNLLSLSQSLSLGSGLWPVLLSATVSPETSEVTSTLRKIFCTPKWIRWFLFNYIFGLESLGLPGPYKFNQVYKPWNSSRFRLLSSSFKHYYSLEIIRFSHSITTK